MKFLIVVLIVGMSIAWMFHCRLWKSSRRGGWWRVMDQRGAGVPTVVSTVCAILRNGM